MKRDLLQLSSLRYDLLIIGGGITGAGVALDASLRGLKVALIDKQDFAGGTSSVSSKLIHGGLRYLEHGQFRLVYEALRERKYLLSNAPHLVKPVSFVVPTYRGSRLPRWKLRLGLTLYDMLAGRANLERSRPLSRKDLLSEFPRLRSDGLRGGAEYYDAQMDDARLCLEVIKTAVAQGACVANYVEALGFDSTGGKITAARVRDRVAGSEFVIEARQVLNATGPWVDAVCRLAGDPSVPHLQPTKGVHVILPRNGYDPWSPFLLLHPGDGRVFFVIPWLGHTLVGTTDTACDESPDQLVVTSDEIAYLLEGYNHFFHPALEPRSVINSFAGLRPIIRQRPGEPSSLSREFQLFTSPSGLLSVAGGKYTTYRHMAEVIVDQVERHLGFSKPRLCRTRHFKLDGAPEGDWPHRVQTRKEFIKRFGLPIGIGFSLVDRYGRRAPDVAAYIGKDASLAEPIIASPSGPVIKAELAYQRDHEMAIYPADHLLRRTRLGLFHPELLNMAAI